MIEKCVCDAEAQLESFLTRRRDTEWFVRCRNPKCGRLGPIVHDPSQAIPSWNAAVVVDRLNGQQTELTTTPPVTNAVVPQ